MCEKNNSWTWTRGKAAKKIVYQDILPKPGPETNTDVQVRLLVFVPSVQLTIQPKVPMEIITAGKICRVEVLVFFSLFILSINISREKSRVHSTHFGITIR